MFTSGSTQQVVLDGELQGEKGLADRATSTAQSYKMDTVETGGRRMAERSARWELHLKTSAKKYRKRMQKALSKAHAGFSIIHVLSLEPPSVPNDAIVDILLSDSKSWWVPL